MRKKIVLVLIIAAAAVGTALATNARKPKPCQPGEKKIFCADGRIVCCPRNDACDCGGGLP